jgi:hypothetical protein
MRAIFHGPFRLKLMGIAAFFYSRFEKIADTGMNTLKDQDGKKWWHLWQMVVSNKHWRKGIVTSMFKVDRAMFKPDSSMTHADTTKGNLWILSGMIRRNIT